MTDSSRLNVLPVSYTHLDVYKRQLWAWRLITRVQVDSNSSNYTDDGTQWCCRNVWFVFYTMDHCQTGRYVLLIGSTFCWRSCGVGCTDNATTLSSWDLKRLSFLHVLPLKSGLRHRIKLRTCPFVFPPSYTPVTRVGEQACSVVCLSLIHI